MKLSSARGPSPALIASVIALVLALAGGATALPGKNKVKKNDIKKGAVTKKAIKKGAVTAKALRAGAVTETSIAAAAVTPAKIGPREAAHLVGAPGEPQFGNGGEGDCVWQNLPPGAEGISGLAPVGFYKDQLGAVHLQGIANAVDGPGGDGDCDSGDPNELEDGFVFALPPGYQPTNLNYLTGGLIGFQLVASAAGGTIEGQPLPPGQVFAQDVALLDGIALDTPAATSAKAKPAKVSEAALNRISRATHRAR